jgi:hypothetical protein
VATDLSFVVTTSPDGSAVTALGLAFTCRANQARFGEGWFQGQLPAPIDAAGSFSVDDVANRAHVDGTFGPNGDLLVSVFWDVGTPVKACPEFSGFRWTLPPYVAPAPPVGNGRPGTVRARDTFRVAGRSRVHQVRIGPSVAHADVLLRWPRRGDRFDAGATEAGAVLKVAKKRTATSLRLRVSGLQPGTLRIELGAAVLKRPTTVTIRVTLKP